MSEIDPVTLQLIVEHRKYLADMRDSTVRVTDLLNRQGAAVDRLDGRMKAGFTRIGGYAAGVDRTLSASMRGIQAALAGVSLLALGRSFLAISDEAKKVDASLRLATQGFGSFGQAQEDVRRIADETRSGLSETSSLYANFVRGAKELGGSQAEAARATETFSKTLKISGADAQQSASATLQFGQALAAGALRGDELNSILEASPRLARLLAESMGQPIGQIKQLGEEGKLTSDKLLAALTNRKFTTGIDSEFRQIPVTFDEAMTRVYNAALITFGAFDRGGEFSTAISNFVGDGADGFANLERSAEQFGITVRSTLAGLGDAFDPLLQAGLSVFEQLGGGAFDLQQYIRATLREADALLNIGPSIANFFGAGGKYDSRLLERYDARQRQEQQRLQGQAAERRFRATPFISGTDIRGNPIAGTPGAGSGRRVSAPASASGKKTKTPKSKLDPEAFAREEAAINDQILRLKSSELVDAGAKASIELERIEASKKAAIADINADDRYTAEQKKKIIALTGTVAALEAAKAIYDRDVQAAKDAVEIQIGRLRNEQDLLRAQSSLTGSRQERRDIELRLVDLAYQQERAELEAIVASKDATSAQKEIARARLAMLGRLQEADTQAVNRDNESPLERRRREVRDTAANMGDAIENVELDAIDRLTDGIANAGAEYVKLGGIAGDVINGIIRDLIRLAAQQAIMAAIGGGSGGGGGGGFLSFLGISGARAAGGPVSGGKTYLVGERGPELFRASSAGTIVPNHELVGAAARGMTDAIASRPAPTQQVVISAPQFDLTKAVITPELYADMRRISEESAARAGAASYKQSMRDAPGAVRRAQRFRTS